MYNVYKKESYLNFKMIKFCVRYWSSLPAAIDLQWRNVMKSIQYRVCLVILWICGTLRWCLLVKYPWFIHDCFPTISLTKMCHLRVINKVFNFILICSLILLPTMLTLIYNSLIQKFSSSDAKFIYFFHLEIQKQFILISYNYDHFTFWV